MKPFLGIDISTDKNNKTVNGEQFICAKPSALLEQTLNNSAGNLAETIKEAKLPLVVRIIQTVCGAVGLLTLTGAVRSLGDGDITLAQAYQNAPWLFWIMIICLVVWAILKVCSVKKQKKVLESDESQNILSKFDSVANSINNELKIPSDAPTADILSFYYKMKDGMPKAVEKGLAFSPYDNCAYRIFTDADNLYIADLSGKYCIPRHSLRAIRTVEKRIRVPKWNKETPPTKGEYKQFKLVKDNNNCIQFKPYYILEFEHNGENWGIFFPKYELPVIENLTGLSAS